MINFLYKGVLSVEFDHVASLFDRIYCIKVSDESFICKLDTGHVNEILSKWSTLQLVLEYDVQNCIWYKSDNLTNLFCATFTLQTGHSIEITRCKSDEDKFQFASNIFQFRPQK